jgi:hypothetical protein
MEVHVSLVGRKDLTGEITGSSAGPSWTGGSHLAVGYRRPGSWPGG